MPTPCPIALSEHHVATVAPATGPLHDPRFTMLEDADLDALAARLLEGRPRPVPIFAYGSLIWNPGFEVQARRHATAIGWHRDFSLSLEHFRGTPERPGLMLALSSGGTCDGVVLDIAEGSEATAMRAILRRELVAHELVENACWIKVMTERGQESALTFYADPVNAPLAQLTIQQQAQRLATAAGAAGSGAEYLLRTARGLADLGIYDRYIWTLQRLVAEHIDASLQDIELQNACKQI